MLCLLLPVVHAVSDLAVVKVDSDLPLPTVQLGRSHNLQAGQWVLALGSPLHLQNSVTAGIISCVDRKAVDLGLAGARTDYIQTDAAINKGNSGGPLVDIEGRVIGISAMKAVAADGVSFAIPIDTAVEVMRQLAEHGRVVRPYVGMKMLQLNCYNAAQFRRRDPNFPDVSGARAPLPGSCFAVLQHQAHLPLDLKPQLRPGRLLSKEDGAPSLAFFPCPCLQRASLCRACTRARRRSARGSKLAT